MALDSIRILNNSNISIIFIFITKFDLLEFKILPKFFNLNTKQGIQVPGIIEIFSIKIYYCFLVRYV